MTLPLDTPTEFTVKRVELKRELPARDGKPAKIILKLGLEANGEKGWAEMFNDIDPATFPKEGGKETLILTQPSNPDYAPTAKRPGQGSTGRGGRPGRSPANDASIEAQVALKAAVELVSSGKAERDQIPALTKTFAEAIRGAKA